MAAIEVDEFAFVDKDLCIGCAVCVPTCQTESIRLVRRLVAEETEALAPGQATDEEQGT